MIKAARKAARTLKRDFGEVENLQVSLKGPANFVTAADHRAEEILREELDAGAARLRLPRRGRRPRTRAPTRPTRWIVDPLDGTIELPARHPAFRDLDRARARGHDRRRRRLQSGQRRAVHRRARQGRLPQRPAAAGGGAQAARRRGRRLRRCRISAAATSRCSARSSPPCRTRSRACAGSAPPRSISPGSRPAASTPIGSATCRPGTSRPASSWCARPAASSPISTAATTMLATGDILAGNETMHRELLALLKEAGQGS